MFQRAGRMIIKQKTFADTFAFFALSCGGFSLPRACPHMHFIMYLTVFKAPFNLYRSPHPLSLLCLVNLNLTRMIHAMSFNEDALRFSLHPRLHLRARGASGCVDTNQRTERRRDIRARETEMSGRTAGPPTPLPCQGKNTGGERLATPVK